MDGQQITSQSLLKELSKLICIATVLVALLAGLIAGMMAFDEARDNQDDVLEQIARTFSSDSLSHFPPLRDDLDDAYIFAQSFSSLKQLRIDTKPPKKNGFYTIEYDGDSWRIFISTNNIGERFVVGQQTEIRDETAWANAASAIIPILIMAAILLLIINWIIWSRLQPIKLLAHKVDQLSMEHIEPLSVQKIPSEIMPFIEAINRLLKRADETIKHQRRFIADASHELRTPVAALSLQAENVEKASSETDRNERFQLLHQSLIRLNGLVNQLLKLARLRNVGADKLTPTSADKILKQTIATLYPLAENKDIDLGVTESTAVQLNDFNGGLSQLFENAIANAIYYTPEGGQVDVSLTVNNGDATFQVIDTGPGIDPAQLENVFTPFYRIAGNNDSGSGLGLAICNEIAQKLNGKISLANRKEGGLNFSYIQKSV
jgi:two-component system OmpR family sensor kinase